tara:strand:+ start:396 stop:1274 length:879 start_codon:yes stop_codon:yes gene_type:complete
VRVLVLGTSGFLGKYIFNQLKKREKVYNTGLSNRKINLTSFNSLKKLILNSNPNVIINCSGLTDVDKCEKNPKYSKKINVDILKNITKIKKSNAVNFKLIHFSTDQVYNPKKNKKNIETGYFHPINIYSKHKLASEKICIQNKGIVFRLNLIGKSKSNKQSFSDWIYRNLKQKKVINGFVDSYYSPLNVTTVSKIIDKILLNKKYNFSGIYNLGSRSGISKFKLIKKFSEKLKIYNKNLVHKKKINDVCVTPRTKYNKLNVNKFTKKFKIKLPSIIMEINSLAKYYEKNKNR